MPETQETSVVPVSTEQASITALRGLYNPELDFQKLLQEVKQGYITRGFRLIQDKDSLINVPHIIVGLTYRPGFLDKTTKIQGDYISVEAVISDEQTFRLPQVSSMVDLQQMEVFPNQPVIYNDGGTGVRRHLTKLLHETGVINVGGSYDKEGERVYDRPFDLWKDGADQAQAGIVADREGEPFRFLALYGLRKSEYQSEFTAPGTLSTTYYFG